MKKTINLILLISITFYFSCTNKDLKPIIPKTKVTIQYSSNLDSDIDTNKMYGALFKRLYPSGYNFRFNLEKKGVANILFEERITISNIKKYIESNIDIKFWDTYNNTEIGNYIYEISNAVLSNTIYPGYLDSISSIIETKDTNEPTVYLTDEQVDSISKTSEEDRQMEVFKKTSPFSAYLYPNGNKENQWNEGPILGYAKITDTGIINEFLSKKDLLDSLPYKDLVFMWESYSSFSTADGIPLLNLYLIKNTRSGKPELNGEDVENAEQDFDPLSKQPMVSLQFSKTGSIIWGNITERSAKNGTGIAITLDDKVFSAPIASEKIEGGRTQITGGSFAGYNGIQESEDLASIINLVKSPYQFKIIGILNVAKDE